MGEAADAEGAKECRTGHSLGGLIATEINHQLFGCVCKPDVVYSHAAQMFDSDTWEVYTHKYTKYLVEKKDVIVSVGAYFAHLRTAAMGEGE